MIARALCALRAWKRTRRMSRQRAHNARLAHERERRELARERDRLRIALGAGAVS